MFFRKSLALTLCFSIILNALPILSYAQPNRDEEVSRLLPVLYSAAFGVQSNNNLAEDIDAARAEIEKIEEEILDLEARVRNLKSEESHERSEAENARFVSEEEEHEG